jgi:chromosome segregation ATPase
MNMKKRPKKDHKFSPTEVGALIEDLRSQFKVFGEGLKDMREKFDILDAKLEALTGIVNHEAKKSELSRTDIANLKNTVAKINDKLADIEKDMHLIKDNLTSKVDRKEFELLEKKVASLAP